MQSGTISSKGDVMKRAEIDRLRSELQKSEENLASAELEVEKHVGMVAELNRSVFAPRLEKAYPLMRVPSLQKDRRASNPCRRSCAPKRSSG